MVMEIHNFFESYLKQDSIFLDKAVLTSTYMPENIIYREEQIQEVANILAPALSVEKPSNVFIFGKTGCLAGDTLVYTNKGYIKIKEVDINLRVLSFNIENKKYEWSPFVFLEFKNENKLLKITLNNGSELILTKDHPLLNNNFKWKKADELNINDQLVVG